MSSPLKAPGRDAFRVRLAAPRMEDGREFIRVMTQSRAFHHPWVVAPCDPEAWSRYLERLERDNEAGFLVRRIADDALCGVVNLNIITYEALCSAYLSYYAAVDQSAKGYMKEGLQLVIDHAFGELGL
ncbi:MAG: GNAT family N-acetyltransferase, partial [Gammaproteobacteria bacterium]|nr:GNAT family N-acetyltransferase [Gammaproteobacteria bacterium]